MACGGRTKGISRGCLHLLDRTGDAMLGPLHLFRARVGFEPREPHRIAEVLQRLGGLLSAAIISGIIVNGIEHSAGFGQAHR